MPLRRVDHSGNELRPRNCLESVRHDKSGHLSVHGETEACDGRDSPVARRRSSFCAALPGERVVRSGGRKVLVLPIDLRVAATPYASCRNISIDPSGRLTDWYHGETTNTAFVESTINQVVSKRFVKKQQKSAEEVRGGQSHSQTRSLGVDHRESPGLARPTIARTRGRMATRNG